MGAILLLAGVGFLLLLTVMFLPGGVLGLFGCLLIASACVVGYVRFGPVWGSALLCALVVCVLVGFCIWMAVFPRTAAGKKMTLTSGPSDGDAVQAPSALVGREGVALTILRPAGKALIDEGRVDVVAEGEFIEANVPVVVVSVEGARTVVRKKA